MNAPSNSLAFAAVVQLIGLYLQEHNGDEDPDFQKFIAWLQYHRHDDFAELIRATPGLQAEVNQLLRRDTAVVLARLHPINTALAALLSYVPGFEGISRKLLPGAELSPQAISILRQFVDSKVRNVFYQEVSDGVILVAEGARQFSCPQPLFVADDVAALRNCGLIAIRESGAPYTKIYGITRWGIDFLASMDQPAPPRNALAAKPDPQAAFVSNS